MLQEEIGWERSVISIEELPPFLDIPSTESGEFGSFHSAFFVTWGNPNPWAATVNLWTLDKTSFWMSWMFRRSRFAMRIIIKSPICKVAAFFYVCRQTMWMLNGHHLSMNQYIYIYRYILYIYISLSCIQSSNKLHSIHSIQPPNSQLRWRTTHPGVGINSLGPWATQGT